MWDRCVEQHFVEDILEGLICVSQTCQSEMMDEGGGADRFSFRALTKHLCLNQQANYFFF